jgi:hypothetical protein
MPSEDRLKAADFLFFRVTVSQLVCQAVNASEYPSVLHREVLQDWILLRKEIPDFSPSIVGQFSCTLRIYGREGLT